MKKYVKRTKTVITPKENSQYFDVEQVTYNHKLTPFEKQWMEFQKNEKKKEKQKQKQQEKENDFSGVAILLVLLFVLVAVLFVYFEINGYPV